MALRFLSQKVRQVFLIYSTIMDHIKQLNVNCIKPFLCVLVAVLQFITQSHMSFMLLLPKVGEMRKHISIKDFYTSQSILYIIW